MARGFNERALRLRESPTRYIDRVREEAARRGLDIILLSTGQPSIPPPRPPRLRLARDLERDDSGLYGYTPTRGISLLVEAILVEMRRWGVDLRPGQVTATAGGQNALFAALGALLREGSEVVVLDPMYFGYWPLLEYMGLRPRVVETGYENGFQPVPDRVAEAVGPRTEAIIVVTPDNPTGRILTREVSRALAEIAVDNDLWLIVDEAYRTIVYEGEHTYLYNLAPENVVALNAFSKDPGIPGWRLGFVYGPEEAVERIRLLVQATVYCPPSPAQRLAAYYLLDEETRRAHLSRVIEEYKARRDALLDELGRRLPEVRYHRPEGGMFVFADFTPVLERLGVNSEEFAVRLLREKGVAVVPGTYFSRRHTGSIRLSFVGEPVERLREGIRRIAELAGGG